MDGLAFKPLDGAGQFQCDKVIAPIEGVVADGRHRVGHAAIGNRGRYHHIAAVAVVGGVTVGHCNGVAARDVVINAIHLKVVVNFHDRRET